MRTMKLVRDLAQIVRLAAPLAIGSFAQAVNELVDRAFLGNFSESALAAVVPGAMMSAMFCLFLSGTIGYSGSIIAQKTGAGDRTGAAAALSQGLWLTLFSLPVVLLAWPLGEFLLTLSGHAPDLLRLESTYFRYALAAGTVTVLTTVLSGHFAAQKRTGIICVALSAGNALNILLDWCLIPVLGISGAGLGLLLAAGLSCLLLSARILRDPALRTMERACWKPDRALLSDIVSHGLPFGSSAIVGAGTFTLYSLCLGHFGAGLLAAANAVFAIHGIPYFIVCAIESAVLVLVGRAYGSADADGMRRHLRAGMLLAILCVVVFYLLLIPFSDHILAHFAPADSADFRRFAGIFLLSMAIRDVFEALQRVTTGALRAVGRTSAILLAHVIYSLGVWLPLFAMTTRLDWPLATWQTMSLACAIHAALLLRAWRTATRSLLRVLSLPPTSCGQIRIRPMEQ